MTSATHVLGTARRSAAGLMSRPTRHPQSRQAESVLLN